jgi:2-oxoglutarate dehydrogenase E2 component (dihydrolipoamide succinyltransferase)
MRKILLVAAATFAIVGQAAYAQDPAQDPAKIQLAQASTTPAAPAADPAPAAPAPQPAPAAQTPSDATPQTAAKPSKPAKKKVAKRRSWEADEAKARGIAAKYGVTW